MRACLDNEGEFCNKVQEQTVSKLLERSQEFEGYILMPSVDIFL